VRLSLLYALLVLYEFCQLFMLEHFFAPTYSNFHISYAADRSATYYWICILTPLSLLPAGDRLSTASQFVLSIFMTYVGLAAPLYFVPFVSDREYPFVYVCLFLCFLLLAIASRITLPPFRTPIAEKGYKRALLATIAILATAFGYGMTQNFHLVDFSKIYDLRDSEQQNADIVLRFVSIYIFSLGGLFLALSLAFKKRLYAFLAIATYILCYGLIYEKAAALAPLWLIYIYFTVKLFSRDSTMRFYTALAAPFFLSTLVFLATSTQETRSPILQFAMGLAAFRQYAVPALAPALYHQFFQTHPHTYWSHISGINYFLHYPYGSHTVAVEMDRHFQLGPYNASFIASDAIEAYGYQALPFVALVVGAFFVVLNTCGRGIGILTMSLLVVLPSIAITNIPFSTIMLTNGVFFLMLFMAWMPQSWRDRTLIGR